MPVARRVPAVFQRAVEEQKPETVRREGPEQGTQEVSSGQTQSKLGWKRRFIGAIADGMSLKAAAEVAGISTTTVYKLRRLDAKFAEAWTRAAEIVTETLEQEAQRRAYHGTERPVFYKGEVCGYINEYSDTMMMFLLKARKPEVYRDPSEYGRGGPINVSVQTNIVARDLLNQMMPEIVGMIDDTRRGSAGTPALDIAGAPGDSGHGREVGGEAAPQGDQPSAGDRLDDSK